MALDVDAVAREIFGLRAWRNLLAEHVEDDHGRCKGCAAPQQGGRRWPCPLQIIATRASQINDEHVEAITTHLGSISKDGPPPLPGECHGCAGPSEGIICGDCERAERQDREKEESDAS